MKKTILSLLFSTMFCTLVLAETPIQIALFNPIQLAPESEAVSGLRINFIYGKNTSVTGVDWGLVNHCTKGQSVGLACGWVNYNEGSFTGWQSGLVSITKGDFLGLQEGLYTNVGKGTGIQYGFINTAGHWEGLQLGFVNYTQTMKGIQIGLANAIQKGGFMPIFPLVNWSM
jgi:hypothetical protein